MLLAQDLNMPTLNGYSGFFPYGIMISSDCNQPQYRLARYVDFIKENKKQTYQTLERRVVTIGMNHCNTKTITAGTGKLPKPIFKNTQLAITKIFIRDNKLRAIVKIINNSIYAIPAISLTTNPFRLSYRFTDMNGNPVSSLILE